MQKRGGRGSHGGNKEQVNVQLLDEIVKLRGENDGIRDAYRASQELKEDLKEAAELAEKAARAEARRVEEEQALELVSRLKVKFGCYEPNTFSVKWEYVAVAGIGVAFFLWLPQGRLLGIGLIAAGLYMSISKID